MGLLVYNDRVLYNLFKGKIGEVAMNEKEVCSMLDRVMEAQIHALEVQNRMLKNQGQIEGKQLLLKSGMKQLQEKQDSLIEGQNTILLMIKEVSSKLDGINDALNNQGKQLVIVKEQVGK